jgi:hypothetical protein
MFSPVKSKSLAIIFFLLLPLFIFTPVTFAQDQNDQAKPAITVDHVAGKVEKLKEKVTLLIKFKKESKVEYHQYLAEKRLAELSYAVENDINLVEPTASRYATYIGRMSTYMLENKVAGKKDDVLGMFERHRKIIEGLQSKFEHDSGWWLAIQHDTNNTLIFTDQLKSL